MRTSLVTTIALAVTLAHAAHGQCQYEVTTFEPYECPSGWTMLYEASALNNAGAWVGWRGMCDPGFGYVAVYCPPEGPPQDLPMPRGAGPWGARASGVNDSGVVVGYFSPGSVGTPQFGCIWWPDGSLTGIEPAQGATGSRATGINSSNMVVGNSGSNGYVFNDGVFTYFPAPGGTTRAISDAGHVTGFLTQGGQPRAYRWKDSVMTLLEPVGDHLQSDGSGVNSAGVVIGVSRTFVGAGYATTPTIWIDSAPAALPLPPGFVGGAALDINDDGVIVGWARTAISGGTEAQVVWVGGAVFKINDLTPSGATSMSDAVGVNDVGDVLGSVGPKIASPVAASVSDLTGDCAVDGADVSTILADWGPREWSVADLNADGIVNGFDLAIVLGEWTGTAR